MLSKPFMLRPLAAAVLLAAAGAAQATITVYTSLAAFTAATTAPGTDTYAGFLTTGTTPSPTGRAAGAYTYTATASTSSFYGAGTAGDPWLSTNLSTDSITFASFSGGVQAIGGNFFGSDINGLFLSGNVTLVATDASGPVTQVITGATTTSFLGFVSTGTMTSLVLSAAQGAAPLWPTADNLVLAKANPIPEPGTYALMLAGLGAFGVLARRRRG